MPPAERFCFVPTASKKSAATHPAVVEALVFELTAVAGSVPACEDVPAPLPHPAPTPRPVTKEAEPARDEWDFLKPASVESRPVLPSAAPGAPQQRSDAKPGNKQAAR